MKYYMGWIVLLAACLTAPAYAALKMGDNAPTFKLPASLAGHTFTFSLAEALKKGPVVVYFYPKAFTSGCTIEAHEFAKSVDKFKALGAMVIGISNDNIDTLNKFSVSECRNKFPVASDKDQTVIKSYDVMLWRVTPYANRTSYVISPEGKIIYSYTAMSPDKHVENTLNALRQWKTEHSSSQKAHDSDHKN